MKNFNIGDLVEGTEDSIYCITGEGSLCEVVDLSEEGILVKLIEHVDEEILDMHQGDVFDVESKFFSLYKSHQENKEEEEKVNKGKYKIYMAAEGHVITLDDINLEYHRTEDNYHEFYTKDDELVFAAHESNVMAIVLVDE